MGNSASHKKLIEDDGSNHKRKGKFKYNFLKIIFNTSQCLNYNIIIKKKRLYLLELY